MVNSFEELSRRRVFDGWAKLDEVEVRLIGDEGSQKPVSRLVLEFGDAAAVLLHDRSKDELLLVRQLRVCLKRHSDCFPLEIVAGKIDAGETPSIAAVREVREEIGYLIDNPLPICSVYSTPGILSELQTIFYAEVDEAKKIDDGKPDEGEHVDLVRLPVDEALCLLADGQIRDGKTVLALMWLRERLR